MSARHSFFTMEDDGVKRAHQDYDSHRDINYYANTRAPNTSEYKDYFATMPAPNTSEYKEYYDRYIQSQSLIKQLRGQLLSHEIYRKECQNLEKRVLREIDKRCKLEESNMVMMKSYRKQTRYVEKLKFQIKRKTTEANKREELLKEDVKNEKSKTSKLMIDLNFEIVKGRNIFPPDIIVAIREYVYGEEIHAREMFKELPFCSDFDDKYRLCH